MYVVSFYIIVCLALAIYPATGKIRLGGVDSKPEFSNFSWFSMMFGAGIGIGIGILTYATGEPLFHFGTNLTSLSVTRLHQARTTYAPQ